MPFPSYGAELQNSVALAENTQTETAAPLSEEEYYRAVKENYDAISAIAEKFSHDIDFIGPKDSNADEKATITFLEEIKPYYIILRDLNAPLKYAEAQAKIKSGADAFIQLIEMISISIDTTLSSEEISDFAQKIEEITPYFSNLENGVFDVLGGNPYYTSIPNQYLIGSFNNQTIDQYLSAFFLSIKIGFCLLNFFLVPYK